MKEVVLDTETTGISIKEGHRIVEIGCIELDNLIPTQNKFHCYLNPERKVSEKALEIHGYTDDFLSDKKRFIQRKGRTGRKEKGRLVVLIAKDTIDEVYYWIGKRKIESAKVMGKKLTQKLEKNEITSESLDGFL